jgi:MFS family permease
MSQGAASQDGKTSSAALRWYVLIVMCLIYTISIADRYVMSTVLEPIRLELKLTDGGVAFLTGVSLALFYVTLGIPIAWLADRVSRRNILAVSLVVWSIMSTLCGISRTYLQLLLARIGVGIGEAGGTPPANSIIADYFPAGRRPMAMAVFALGAPIGAWLGADMAGAVARAYGWRAAFLVLGLPGVLVGALVFLTIKEPQRGRLDATTALATPSFVETLRYLFRQRACLHVMMGGGLSAFWGWGLMWFTPTFFQRAYHMDVGQAGALLGPIHLVAGSAASIATAWLLSHPAFTDPRRVLALLAGVTAAATVPSILVFWTHDLALARIMLWLFIPAIYFYLGPAMAMVQNLAPPKMRAMFIAISLLLANVLNLIVAPQGVGWLSDMIGGSHGPDAQSLRLALLVLAPSGFWAAWHYWAARGDVAAEQKAAVG